MAQRKLKFICINDGNVREMTDTGLVKGETSSNRQAIIRVLGKRVEVDGKKLSTFMLAEAPTVELYPEDPFDQEVLRDRQGNLILPDAVWLAERARRIRQSTARQEEMQEKARDVLKQDVAEGLTDLIGMLRSAGAVGGKPQGGKAQGKAKAGAEE